MKILSVIFAFWCAGICAAQDYYVSQLTNTCPDLQVLSYDASGGALSLTMQVLKPKLTNYYIKDAFAGQDVRVGTNAFTITNSLTIKGVGWHGFYLHTNFNGKTLLFNGAAQTNAVWIRVSKTNSDLVWFSRVPGAAPKQYRNLFSGECILQDDAAIINTDAGGYVTADTFGLADGWPRAAVPRLAVHAIDRQGNLILLDQNAVIYSYNALTRKTNWTHAFSGVVNIAGNPIGIDASGAIHVAGRAADPGGSLQLHHVLDQATGKTIASSGVVPPGSISGASIAIGSDGSVIGAEYGGTAFKDDSLLYNARFQQSLTFCLASETGSDYIGLDGTALLGVGVPKRISLPELQDAAMIDNKGIIAISFLGPVAYYSTRSNAWAWTATNAPHVFQSPLALSETAFVYLATNGLAVCDVETGAVLKLLSDSDILDPGLASDFRFGVNENGILIVASELGCAAYDVHDYIDAQFLKVGNGCWHRFGFTGSNNQQQPVPVLPTNALAFLSLRHPSHFTATDPDGAIYIADKNGLTCLASNLTSTRWTVAELGVAAMPIVDDGFIYYCGISGLIEKRNKQTGELIWSHAHPANSSGSISAYPFNTPFAADLGRLYAADDGGSLSCFAKDSGETLWSRYFNELCVGKLAVTPNGQLFAATSDGYAMSFDGATGRLLWRVDLGEGAFPHLGVAMSQGGTLVVPLYDGSVLFLDPFTGLIIRTVQAPSAAAHFPVFGVDTNMYFAVNQSGVFSVLRNRPATNVCETLFSTNGIVSGEAHLINSHILLVNDRWGTSYLVDLNNAQTADSFDTFSRTLNGWKQLSGDLFLMDGKNLQIRRINPDGFADPAIENSDGAEDNTYFWTDVPDRRATESARDFVLGLGDHATFVAPFSRSDAVSFQWTLNGQIITGATNYFLLATNAGPANSGVYGVLAILTDGSAAADAGTIVVSSNASPGHINWLKSGAFLSNIPVIDESNDIYTLQIPDGQTVQLARLQPSDGATLTSILIATNLAIEPSLPTSLLALGNSRVIVDLHTGLADVDTVSGRIRQFTDTRDFLTDARLAGDYDGAVLFRDPQSGISRYDPVSLAVTAVSADICYNFAVLSGNGISASAITNIDMYRAEDVSRGFWSVFAAPGDRFSLFPGAALNAAMSVDINSTLLIKSFAYSGTPSRALRSLTQPVAPNVSSVVVVHETQSTSVGSTYPPLAGADDQSVTFDAGGLYSIDPAAGAITQIYAPDSIVLGMAVSGEGDAVIVTAGDIVGINLADGTEKWRVDLPIATDEGDFEFANPLVAADVSESNDGTLLIQGSDFLMSMNSGYNHLGPGWLVKNGSPDGSRRPVPRTPPSVIETRENSIVLKNPGIAPGPYTLSVSTDLLNWKSDLLIEDAQTVTNGVELPLPPGSTEYFRIR